MILNCILKPGANPPVYATAGSAGADLKAYLVPEGSVTIEPGQWKVISTGMSVRLQPGYEIQIRPRSGLAAKFGVTVLNSPGTIDSDYRGDIGVILVNHGKEPFRVNHGDRIAQAVIASVVTADNLYAASYQEDRQTGGFGSTGQGEIDGR